MITTQKCYKCQIEKPIGDFRFKYKSRGIRHTICKECHKRYTKEYYNKDAERHRQRSKEWIRNNLERKRKRNNAYMVGYRQCNPIAVKERIREHYKKNKEAYVNRSRLRREREFGWADSTIIQKVKEQFDYQCFACGFSGDRLSIDHHLSLHEGGQLVPGNLTLLCTSCNNNKKIRNIYTHEQSERLQQMHSEQLEWVVIDDFTIESGIDREMIVAHHYLHTCPASKYSYLLKYKNKNVGVAVFSRPSRQSIKADLELSRFFIMAGTPKNTESFFLGYCLRQLRKDGFIGKIVTFADADENHKGTIYKATNWIFDGMTQLNYHYLDINGQRIHKRQVWNRAKQNNLKESEESKLEALTKIIESPKSRYYYIIY